jgi:hydrogenase maturation protease
VNQSRTLVLGVGNTLLSDEGAGIHALNLLQTQHPEIAGIEFIDGGTLSFTLASYIADCDNIIVLDATELKSPAGTVKTLTGREMDDFLGAAKRSPHEVGLLDLFDIARLTCSLPRNRALICIQPGYMGWGMRPSAAVRQALDQAVDAALELITRWQQLSAGQHDAVSDPLCYNY